MHVVAAAAGAPQRVADLDRDHGARVPDVEPVVHERLRARPVVVRIRLIMHGRFPIVIEDASGVRIGYL